MSLEQESLSVEGQPPAYHVMGGVLTERVWIGPWGLGGSPCGGGSQTVTNGIMGSGHPPPREQTDWQYLNIKKQVRKFKLVLCNECRNF